ncbi:MAG: HAD family hydrolase [Candidatus Kariarchaeaceae archaeon]
MDIECILIDFDNTLLKVPDEVFYTHIPQKIMSYFLDIFDQDTFFQAFEPSMKIMLENDHATETNFEAFLDAFSSFSGLPSNEIVNRFRNFYSNDFSSFKQYGEPIPNSMEIIKLINELDIKLILATQPMFLEVGMQERLSWAKLTSSDFLYITHAENSTNAKPNPKYYSHLLDIAETQPDKTLMVGNDYLFDMSAAQVGIKTWLANEFTDNEMYKDRFPINFEGSLTDLISFLEIKRK